MTRPHSTRPLTYTLALASSVLLTAGAAHAQQSTPPASQSDQTPAEVKPAAAPATAPAEAAASNVISAPAAAPEPAFLAKSPIQISGILDGYANYNANNPASKKNQLRNFDLSSDTVSLNMAKVVISHEPAPLGIRADIGFGQAFQVMHPSHPSGGGLKYVEQMFLQLKPKKLKGFELDYGQFVSPAGAEVIESVDNWNYSRSLLYAFACPYYHFGFRATMPVTSALTVGFDVVQGWNNIFDNNTGKTFIGTGAYAKKYYTLSGNYLVGPENDNTNKGWRNLIDTTLLLTPNNKFNAYINYDYGQNRNANATGTGVADLAHWQGIAAAAHFQVLPKATATVRGEYYIDPNGFTTGTPQALNEVTVTGDYLLHPGILARAEFRRDHSNMPYFDKNKLPGTVQSQPTFEFSLIGFFGPKT